MTDHFKISLDETRHSEYPLYGITTDAGKHTALCFVYRLQLVWNKNLAVSPKRITKDDSTQWRAFNFVLIHFKSTHENRSRGVGYHQQGLVEKHGHLKHFKRRSERLAYSEFSQTHILQPITLYQNVLIFVTNSRHRLLKAGKDNDS